MRIPNKWSKFLNGDEYSSGARFVLPRFPAELRYRSRLDVLAEIATSKNVLHIGFADHDIETIERKRADKSWLHDILSSKARRCVGVDIDETAVNYCRDTLDLQDVYALDLLGEQANFLTEEHWDLVLLPEVLEHLDNPVDFLSRLRMKYLGVADQLVITVPNAFRFANWKAAQERTEAINTDHRYWFTPYTVLKVAHRAGYDPASLQMCAHRSVDTNPAQFARLSLNPLLREDMVVVLNWGQSA